MQYSYKIVLSVLLVLSPLVAKWLAQNVGKTLGWYLWRRTQPRRHLILAQVNAEEKEFQVKERRSPKSDDGDWEKVEINTVGVAKDGSQGDQDWQGVIGFFHPFWYIYQTLTLKK